MNQHAAQEVFSLLWRSMYHVFLAQAVMVWIYIIWPMIMNFIEWVDRRYSDGIDDTTAFKFSETKDKTTYRGKWRDYQDASTAGQQQSQHKQSAPERQPLTPRAAHLATLGLDKMPDAKTLRRTYRRLAKTWHPDRVASAGSSDAERVAATQKMAAINEAYDWLVANPV